MFKRILYLVSEKQEEKTLVKQLVTGKETNVLLASLLACGSHDLSRNDGESGPKAQREDQERKCWLELYELEEEFKKENITSSVVAQQEGAASLLTLVTGTKCDLVVIPASYFGDRVLELTEDLVTNLPCPVIITNS